MRPIASQHPILSLQVAQLLKRRDGLSAAEAVAAAQDLIHMLASSDIFLVKGDWMDERWRPNKFDWEDVPVMAEEYDDRKPWFPDGFRS